VSADRVHRRLAAILAADVEGYSRHMAADEIGTLKALRASRAVIDPAVADYGGRVFNTAGDSVIAEFGSVVDAVECAVALQRDWPS
jgi:adenylate cyclase